MPILKSAVVTLGVVVLGWIGLFVIILLEPAVGISRISSPVLTAVGVILLIAGIIIRGWAAYIFYTHTLKVIALKPQASLMTRGPFRFSRNPLILGIVSIVLGLAFIFGSWGGIVLSFSVFLFWDFWIRTREEETLEQEFGEEYRQYKRVVPRWIGFRNILSQI